MKRLWFAFIHSLHGFRAAYRDEAAFREECWLALILIPLACLIAPTRLDLVLMVGSVLLLMLVELFNTAVEATVNRISLEIHPLAKKAKDTASAAVLVAILIMLITWASALLA